MNYFEKALANCLIEKRVVLHVLVEIVSRNSTEIMV